MALSENLNNFLCVYYFQCDTPEDMNSWIDAVRSAIRQRRLEERKVSENKVLYFHIYNTHIHIMHIYGKTTFV